MGNDQEKTKAKKTKKVAKKASNRKAAKKKTRKASEKTAARQSRLKTEERISIKKRLIAHFGRSKIEKAIGECRYKYQQDPILLQWKKKLEQELEDEERDINDYYEKIDEDYRRVGRPNSVLNWREFDFLCSLGCTLEEIAGFFQMGKTTIQDHVLREFGETFSERYEKLSQGVKVSLRRKQIMVALDGDVSMLKFLGKNLLGQKDKVDFDGEVKVNSWVDLVNNLEPEQENNENDNKDS